MTEEEVKKLLARLHEEEAGTMILEPQSVFNKGVIGYDEEQNKLIYSYELLAQALTDSFLEDTPNSTWEEAEVCAIDWLEYNTMRSAPYYADYPLIKTPHYEEEE